MKMTEYRRNSSSVVTSPIVFERSPLRKPIHLAATVDARMIGNAMSEGVIQPSFENAILYVKNARMTGPAKHQATRAMSTLNEVIGSIGVFG